eukprot:CAMPEP_0118962570 /NCGR_PEP_ID=MMETSP1173-20130426/862_1 /TAXON_ID=1034831 /ORGANISM="Rhizochromulina marina cf, Strain CCMP1243" /LENGTH=138 /DNA_ID=CAMNT_0006910853 /DNA_START=373 /DNA_END=787 /DNA_ORIENTATION=-
MTKSTCQASSSNRPAASPPSTAPVSPPTTSSPAASATSASCGEAASTPPTRVPARVLVGFKVVLRDHVDHLLWDTKVFDRVSTNVALGELPETVTISRCADHLFQIDVHPRVAVHKPAVVCVAVLELDEHRVALRRPE